MKKQSPLTTVVVVVVSLLAIWLTLEIFYFAFLVALRSDASFHGTPDNFISIANDILKFGSWTLTSHFLVFTTGTWGTAVRCCYIAFVFAVWDRIAYRMAYRTFRMYWDRLNNWIDELADNMDD